MMEEPLVEKVRESENRGQGEGWIVSQKKGWMSVTDFQVLSLPLPRLNFSQHQQKYEQCRKPDAAVKVDMRITVAKPVGNFAVDKIFRTHDAHIAGEL